MSELTATTDAAKEGGPVGRPEDQRTAAAVLLRLLDGRRGHLSPGDGGTVRPHIRVSTDLYLTQAEHDALARLLAGR